MLHEILSIFVGVLGGLSARVIYSFVASIALLPILLVYLAANRQFIAGLTAGAVKG